MPATFQDLIAENKRTSLMLVAIFVLFIVALAFTLALALLLMMDPDRAAGIQLKRGLGVGAVAGAIALGVSFLSYFTGDQLILGVQGAHEIQHTDDPQLFNVVEEMAIAAGLPMPKVYLIDDPSPNAFATGRDPAHASVAITTGLRTKLTRDELQGVIAHEMSHVRNYDIRLMLLLAVLIGTVTMLSDFFWQALRWGPRGNSSSDTDDSQNKSGSQLLMIVVFVLALLFSLLAPLLASMLQFAVSRQREYLADASGVELTRNPEGLANALKKLTADPTPLKNLNRGTAHLFIVNPIKKFAALDTVFASHPPIESRIERLLSLVRS